MSGEFMFYKIWIINHISEYLSDIWNCYGIDCLLQLSYDHLLIILLLKCQIKNKQPLIKI